MKTQAFIAGVAAMAPIAAGANVHRRGGGLHGGATPVVETKLVTVLDIQTVWEGSQSTGTPSMPLQVVSSVPAAVSTATTPFAIGSATSVAGAQSSSLYSSQLPSSGVPSPVSSLVAGMSSVSATTFATAVSSSAANSSVASSSNSTGKISSSSLTPNGKKAGLSGYVGIQNTNAFSQLSQHISWYSDYTPDPPASGNVQGIGMLWGASGSPCGSTVTDRVSAFNALVAKTTPSIMFGFYEPDCSCGDSSDMSTSSGTADWNQYLAPLAAKGTVLGSPSMCKQKDEDWLTPFSKSGSQSLLHADWEVTSVHINKPNIQGVMEDIEYYVSKYQKPIWVSEFACVDDQSGWSPCTDQSQIDQFIQDAVKFFQANESVVAFGPSNGDGLGNVWPLTDSSGKLTASGQTYLNAIKAL